LPLVIAGYRFCSARGNAPIGVKPSKLKGDRNLLIIRMFAMIDIYQINNLLAFIRKENQPVLFCDSRGLPAVKRAGEPAAGVQRIF
jgi:hypothetical protein